ncbi:putative transcription factor/ chromatin remodeling BED-type(Zn) family [Helianthus annuus]|nr:putative transcription factor/ chromatin remodeling BED-type(Zn) family [Helianthus annuus]
MASMESTASKVLKRKSNDIGWEYGSLVDPNKLDRTQCDLCKKTMSGGIYRLKQHIAGIPGSVTVCPKATKDDQLRVRNALNEAQNKKKAKQSGDEALRSEVNIGDETIDLDDCLGDLKESRSFGPINRFGTSQGKNKQSNLNNVFKKEQMTRVKQYVCKWAYECAIPFHAFERDSFKQVVEAIGQFGPSFMPPTRYEMATTFLKKEVEDTKTCLKKFEEEWKFTGCSIMTDAWSDRTRKSIMNLCVNSKLGTVFLSSKECSDEAHTSANIFEYVDKCIEEVGPENVVQIVTDNASNNMGASKLLKEKRPTIFWTSCATHTINLMLEAIGGLTRYKKTLDQAKKLTIFIYAHHKTLAMMRKYTKKRNIVRPGVTRFASAFLTLQSLSEKKCQLRHMFSSGEWEKCKFAKTEKGIAAYETVVSPSFWGGVTTCLKVFAPLVKVLRMVDADWKPSMGFIYGELQWAKKEIIKALNDNKNAYEPILDIISKKSSKRLDTCLHMTAYILNPYYFYNNSEVRDDLEANDAVVECVGVLFPKNYDMQSLILSVELPIYKRKQEKFDRPIALKACEINNENFDPANWWETYGNSTPNLKKIAMRILSLTTSSSGCERNWSIFEGVHTKKRNRLESSRLNDLVFVQYNANLLVKNKNRRVRNREVLKGEDASEAKEWIEDDGEEEEVESGVNVAAGVDEVSSNRTSARKPAKARQLYDEEFESEKEDEVDEEIEYESDGVEIIEHYGDDDYI